MKKFLKVLLIIVICLVIVVSIGGFIIGNFFYNMALNPEGDRSAVMGADQNQIDAGGDTSGGVFTFDGDKWLNEVGSTDLHMTSYDGLKLHSYMVQNETPSKHWVIACHGYTGRAKQMSWAGAWFYEQGYNVLLPDARGHGDSEGDYIGMGWDDRLDIVDWINRIIEDFGAEEIVLYGVSMGGATVMMVSGEDLPPQVKAIVEDCGYTSAYDEFAYQLNGVFGLPNFPIMQFASIVSRIRAGYWLKEASALDQVAKSVTPMLFIHGDADTFVPSKMVYELYDAATCPKELLVVEGAGHAMSSAVAGQVYWQTVTDFLAKYVTAIELPEDGLDQTE